MKKPYVYVGMILLAVVAGGFVWQSRQQSAVAIEDLQSAIVARGDMLVAVSATGRVRPAEQANLSFATGGRVAEVLVDVGDTVEQHDVLARLDNQRLRLEVERAKADLAAAEAQLARLKAGVRAEEIDAVGANLRAAEAQLAGSAAERDQVAGGARASQIAAVEAEVAAALTQQKKAQDWYDTTLTCVTIRVSKGERVELPDGEVIIAPEDMEHEICPLLGMPEEQARHRLAAANAALEAARERLKEVEAGAGDSQLRAAQASVDAAAARRDAARAQLDQLLEGPTEGQTAAAEARVDQARGSLAQAELAVEHALLKAPFGATVAAVQVSAGGQASAGVPAIALVDVSNYHVNVAVDEMEVGRLMPGQAVHMRFDAIPETVVPGTVRRIAASSGLEGGVVTYNVRIDLEPTDAPIRADMTANATIIVEELRDVLKIPTWAVRFDRNTGEYYVHRRVGDQVERASIEVGARFEGAAEVVDGLSEGDEVVRVPETSPFGLGGG